MTRAIGRAKPKGQRETEKFVGELLEKRLQRVLRFVEKVTDHNCPTEKVIHDLRTETRRADAGIRLFDAYLPEKESNEVRREMKRIRKKAGITRDHDIMIPRLSQLQSTLPESIVTWLVQRNKTERAAAASKCHRRCQKSLRRDFRSNCESLAARFRYRKSNGSIGKHCRSRVVELYRDFELEVESLAMGMDCFHEVRIRARRLRYSMELAAFRFQPDTLEVAVELLSTLQDSLGRINDQRRLLDFVEGAVKACDDDTVAIILRETLIQLQKARDDDQQRELEHLNTVVPQLRNCLNAEGLVLAVDVAELPAS